MSQQQQLPEDDVDSVDVMELKHDFTTPLSDGAVEDLALKLRPKDKFVVVFRRKGNSSAAWTMWTGVVKTAAVVDESGATRPNVAYNHDLDNVYAFPQDGYDYGEKSTVVRNESARPARSVKPVPTQTAPATGAAPTPAAPVMTHLEAGAHKTAGGGLRVRLRGG